MHELSYAEFIRNRRNRLGLSQKDVALVLNCTVQAISRYENGKVHVSLSLVGTFCHVLRLSISDFFMKKDDDEVNVAPVIFDKQVFSSNLTLLCHERNLSFADLSDQTGITVSRLTKFENCISLPSLEEFVEICDFFCLDYESFYLGIVEKRKASPVIAQSPVESDEKYVDKVPNRFTKLRKSMIFGIVSFSVAIVFVFLTMVSFAIASDTNRTSSGISSWNDVCQESSLGFSSKGFDSGESSHHSSFSSTNGSFDHDSSKSNVLDSNLYGDIYYEIISSSDSKETSTASSSCNGFYFDCEAIFSWAAPDGLVKGKDFDLQIYNLDLVTETLHELRFGEESGFCRAVINLSSLRKDLDLTYRVFDVRFPDGDEIKPVVWNDFVCFSCDGPVLIQIEYSEYVKVNIVNNTDCEPRITFYETKTKKEQTKEKVLKYSLIKPKIYNPSSYIIRAYMLRPDSDLYISKEKIGPGETCSLEGGIYNSLGFSLVIEKI